VLHSKRPEDRINPMTIDPTLRLELLAKVQGVELAGGSRNLFQLNATPNGYRLMIFAMPASPGFTRPVRRRSHRSSATLLTWSPRNATAVPAWHEVADSGTIIRAVAAKTEEGERGAWWALHNSSDHLANGLATRVPHGVISAPILLR
jgi:hypothetical protein